MGKEKKIFNSIHKSTKRNYLKRMLNNKFHFMKIAKKYDKNYWDGSRDSGYGGYKYIEGYWTPVAKKLIKKVRKVAEAAAGQEVGPLLAVKAASSDRFRIVV